MIGKLINKILKLFGLVIAKIELSDKDGFLYDLLEERHLENCQVVPNRVRILEELPKGGKAAEIGIGEGVFTEWILKTAQPEKLHLIDIDRAAIDLAGKRFAKAVAQGNVVLHLGPSFRSLKTFEDNYFDWIFIDGDHRYDFVRDDLELGRLKTKEEGLILLHDYIVYSYNNFSAFGVVRAVNEFCRKYDYQIRYLSLEPSGFNTVALKKIGSG